MPARFKLNGKSARVNAPADVPLQIIEHMSTNLCRCGTYTRIVRAIERAAKETSS